MHFYKIMNSMIDGPEMIQKLNFQIDHTECSCWANYVFE